MKRVLIAASLLFATHGLFAQVNKGQWLVGGNAGFETSKFGDDDSNKYTSFQLSPNAGYFFIDNFAAGLRLDLNSTKFKDEDDASTSFVLAPFARYYFLPAAEKVNVFADASYGFGSMKNGSSESFNFPHTQHSARIRTEVQLCRWRCIWRRRQAQQFRFECWLPGSPRKVNSPG